MRLTTVMSAGAQLVMKTTIKLTYSDEREKNKKTVLSVAQPLSEEDA